MPAGLISDENLLGPTSCVLIGQKEGQVALWPLLGRELISLKRAPASRSNQLPKALPPNTIMLGIQSPHRDRGSDTDIPQGNKEANGKKNAGDRHITVS